MCSRDRRQERCVLRIGEREICVLRTGEREMCSQDRRERDVFCHREVRCSLARTHTCIYILTNKQTHSPCLKLVCCRAPRLVVSEVFLWNTSALSRSPPSPQVSLAPLQTPLSLFPRSSVEVVDSNWIQMLPWQLPLDCCFSLGKVLSYIPV